MRQYRIKYVCTLYDILVLCFILWWISSSFIFNSRVISNEQLIYSYTLSVVYVATRIFRSSISVQRRLYICIAFLGSIEAIIGWGQYWNIIESNHPLFSITGTFTNPGPYGAFLGIALLIQIHFAWHKYIAKQYMSLFMLLIVGLLTGSMFIASFSRAAWVALLIAVSFFFFLFQKKRYRYAGLLLLILFLFSSPFLYQLKKQSADGRLFIWRVCTELIQSKPYTGGGASSFAARYMYAQADFLEKHPNHEYAAKATNNIYAFNEYLRIACEYGLPGILLYVTIWLHGIYCKATYCDRLRKLLLIYLAVFSLFSYTFQVLPLAVLCIVLGAFQNNNSKFTFYAFPMRYLVIMLLLMTIIAWSGTRSSQYEKKEILFTAKQLYTQQNYADAKEYLEKAAYLSPTSEILMDLGNSYFHLQNNAKAEHCFRIACNMVPGRILPQYYLFRFYAITMRNQEAITLGQSILFGDYQLEGSIAMQAKTHIKRYLSDIRMQAK